nr:hypothetical protein B0A51_01358 [Rachicladosporium sp. CCFEE 5018]
MSDQSIDAQQYTAPYEAWPGVSAAPDCYYLTLHQGYQVSLSGWLDNDGGFDEPRIKFMGKTGPQYATAITPEQREHIRHFVGVAKVTQFSDEQRLRGREVQWFPERKYGGRAYMVLFTDNTYTVGEHLARIGHTFPGVDKDSRTRLYILGRVDKLSEGVVRDIFSDPKVLEIWETGSRWL